MTKKPLVSIVIPTKNEENYIAKCLDSLVNQTYDSIEVNIVDGMSTDRTIDIIQDYQKKYRFIHVFENEKKYTPFALNIGAKHAKGEFIGILGAHSYVNDDYIEKNVEKLMEYPDVSCVGGILENVYENNLAYYISKAMSSSFGVGNALFRYSKKEQLVDTVAFGVYRREVFDEIGYFDEEMIRNQDDEFNYRLQNHGGKILFSPEIKSNYFIRGNLKKLYRQYNQYGYWKVKVIEKIGQVPSIRHIIPSAFVLSIGLTGLLGVFSKWFLAIFLLIIFTYLLGGIYFGVKQLGMKKLYGLPILLLVFFILHISYGLGFIEGFIHKLMKRENKEKVKLTR